MQFIFWIVSDTALISAGITFAPAVCSTLGTLGFVYGALVGLYEAYGKYQAIQQEVSCQPAEKIEEAKTESSLLDPQKGELKRIEEETALLKKELREMQGILG